jgi:hypothetical protein
MFVIPRVEAQIKSPPNCSGGVTFHAPGGSAEAAGAGLLQIPMMRLHVIDRNNAVSNIFFILFLLFGPSGANALLEFLDEISMSP